MGAKLHKINEKTKLSILYSLLWLLRRFRIVKVFWLSQFCNRQTNQPSKQIHNLHFIANLLFIIKPSSKTPEPYSLLNSTGIPATYTLYFSVREMAGLQGDGQLLDAWHIGHPHMLTQFLLDIHSQHEMVFAALSRLEIRQEHRF